MNIKQNSIRSCHVEQMYSIYGGSSCNECVHVADIGGSLMAPNYHFRVSDNGRSGVRTGDSSSMNQINWKGWVPQWNHFRWWEDGFTSADRKEKKKTCLPPSVKEQFSVSLQQMSALLLWKQEEEEEKVSSYSKTINHDKRRGGRWSFYAHTNQTFPSP